MNTSWKLWVAALSGAALMAACGGDGDGGDSLFGGGTGTTTATDLILTIDKASVANTGSDVVTASVTAIDSNRNAVSGAAVQITADSDAVVTTAGTATGTDGKLSGTIGIGGNRANRVINVTATVGSATRTVSFQVIGARLVATLVPAVVAPGAAGAVQYRLTDQAGSPMAGQSITVTGAGFSPAESTGATGTNGEFSFTYTAPAAAGTYAVNATAGGVSDSQNVQVQTTSTIDPVTVTITSASVSANPSVVGINTTDSTANRSEIRALFLTTGNVPVRNVRVRFDLDNDPNAIGGDLTTGIRGLVYSDANGVTTSAYIPGTRSSPTDGVRIRVCYSPVDFPAGDCPNPVAVVTTLTVTSEPLTVSIGTDATIVDNGLSYIKQYLVSVVDSSGAAKADVELRVSLDLPLFRKGFYAYSGSAWAKSGGDLAICANEDLNRNGVLEAGEDVNGNGTLQPRASDVSVRLLSPKTDADGTAVLQIQYAKSFGTWVDALITVAASGVLGTEGRATYSVSPVPVDAAAVKDKDVPPAFLRSPYGVEADCANPN